MEKKTRTPHRSSGSLSRVRSGSRSPSPSPAPAVGRSRSKTASVSGRASSSKPQAASTEPAVESSSQVETQAESSGGGDEEKLEGEDVYQAEGIIGKQLRRGQVLYRVKWLGYPVSQSTWEPLENIGHCIEFIDEYNRRTALQQKGPRKRRAPREDVTPEEEESDGDERPPRRRARRTRTGRSRSKHTKTPSPSVSPAPPSPEPEETFGTPTGHRSPNKRPRVLLSSSPSPPPVRPLTPIRLKKDGERGKSEQKLERSEDKTMGDQVAAPDSDAGERAPVSPPVGPVESPADRGDSLLREEPVDRLTARNGSVGALDGEGLAPPAAAPEEEVSRDAACAADLDDAFVYWRPFPAHDAAADGEARHSSIRLAEHLKQWQSKAVSIVGLRFGPGPLSAAAAKAFVHFRFTAPDVANGAAVEWPGRDILQAFPLALVRQYLPDKLALFYQTCAYLVPDAPRDQTPADLH